MSFNRRMCWPFHEFAPDFGEDEVEAMSRLGFNQAAINCDSWPAAAPQLFQMVDSEIWPGMGDPEILDWSKKWLREKVDLCRKYGLDPYIILFEPLIPFEQYSVYAPQSVREDYRSQIEEECLGFRDPGSAEDTTEGYEFAADFNRLGRPLCISHPKVQAFYRTRTHALAEMLPGLKGVHIMTGDGRVEFCDQNCPRCRDDQLSTSLDYQSSGLITMLNCMWEGAAKARDDFEIVMDNHGLLNRTKEIIEGVNFPLPMMIKDTGFDCDMAPTEPAPIFRRMARLCNDRNQTWYVLAELAQAEEYGLIFGYPDPITIVRKVQACKAAGAKNLATFWGVAPQAQTMNDRILSAVMQNPDEDEKTLLKAITTEVFGEEACDAWLNVWHCLRACSEMWMRRRGYHSLRQNFYAARFKHFAWPVTFSLTSPDGVPEFGWQWPMCFPKNFRDSNLMIMPDLIDHLDCAIEAAQEALAKIPHDCRPTRCVYEPHRDWDSRRYGSEALAAICCIREIVASEMHTYQIAHVRDLVEDRSLPKETRRQYTRDTLPALFQAEAETMERLIPPLKTQLAHLRVPDDRPDLKTLRTCGNTEKTPERWEFIPLLEQKIADIPDALIRAEAWLEDQLQSEVE